MSICVGDIIDLDIESSVNKLAKIIEVKKGKVEAIDLSNNGILILPIDCLHDKQDLTGIRLRPSEERDLKLLGAKNLWVKLTPKQYEKYNTERTEKESLIKKEKELDDIQMKFLMNFFKNSKEEKIDEDEQLNMFSLTKEIEENNSPLLKYIKKKEI